MFTGIVAELGEVAGIDSARFTSRATNSSITRASTNTRDAAEHF